MANSVSGAYSDWSFDVSPVDAALLQIATAIGVNYVPIAVATQVGAGGTNYVFLCRAELGSPGATQCAAKVYIHAPPPGLGDPHVSQILEVAPQPAS
jgi:hypothetical protein